jgi:hypothetical protein
MPFTERRMKRSLQLSLPVVVLLIQGCAPLVGQTRNPPYYGNGPGAISLPPIVAFQDSIGPLSYRAPLGSEGPPREVRGEACQSALTLPVGLVWAAIKAGSTARAAAFLGGGWGDGGYSVAASRALAGTPGARLTNVRADLHTRIILGVWRQQCVQITAEAVPVH